jgi:pyridoxamine 5'-phosphate oxidase
VEARGLTAAEARQRGPLSVFRRWFREAERARVPLPEAMALATADAAGRPSVRFVLLKQADERGFVFFTDARSRKGRELRDRPAAAVVFYWHETGKQVRIEGRVEMIDAAEADAYWETRPRESRLAASVSRQSAVLDSRTRLLGDWRRLQKTLDGKPIPRPRSWLGFRLVPTAVEFWRRADFRLHERERWVRRRARWTRTTLQP